MSHHFENEPRDWHGRWTTGGPTAFQRAASDKKFPPTEDQSLAEAIQKAASDDERNVISNEQVLEKVLEAEDKGIVNSEDMYKDVTGNFVSERQKLHERIINEFLAQGHSKTGMAWALGGAPANGKSTLVNTGFIGNPTDIVLIDPDAIKAKLPEYKAMNSARMANAAAFAHEESSYLSKVLLARTAQAKKDLMIDAVNDGEIEKLDAKIRGLKQQGYRTRGDYVSLDTKKSLQLAQERGEKTGRFVPPTYIKEQNKTISKIFPELLRRNTFDELNLWDTNINGQPRLVVSQRDGKITIHNQELYNNFLNKAKE